MFRYARKAGLIRRGSVFVGQVPAELDSSVFGCSIFPFSIVLAGNPGLETAWFEPAWAFAEHYAAVRVSMFPGHLVDSV